MERRNAYDTDWHDRQSALADFSRRALQTLELDVILHEACVQVGRGLRLPIAKVLQRLPGTSDLLVRACVGLPRELTAPDETRVPGEHESAAGYALTVNTPVVSHIPTETRFRTSEIVRRAGIKVSLNVVIPFESGPFGTLEVDSLEEREFSPEDIDFLQTYANLLGAAVERQRLGSTARTLMRELQHRVKNDLQVITSLLLLESRQAQSAEARARLQGVAGRVDSLSLLHDRLYASGRVGEVELDDYLRSLCQERFRMHALDPDGDIRLELDLAPVTSNHDQAVAMGLLVNEFLTNSLKHAFPTERGLVRITLERLESDLVRLSLADNGIGIPPAESRPTGGMGINLIRMMAEQIGAEFQWAGGDGTKLAITVSIS